MTALNERSNATAPILGGVSVTFYSAAWRGGSGWFVYALCDALAEVGARVMLIAPEAEPAEREPRHEKMKRIVLPQGASGRGGLPYRAWRSLWRVVSTFPAIARGRINSRNFLVTHIDWLVIGVLQFVWMRLLGGRPIYIVHDVKPHAWGFPESLRWFEEALLSISFRLPSHIVTLTHVARQQLLDEFAIPPEKVTVIPHGAFTSDQTTDMPGNLKLLVFGMLRRNKRILETIQAMALLPDDTRVQLVIAGAPHAEDMIYWRACEAALAEVHVPIHTEIGFVPEERVGELVSECDALILPYEEFNSQSGVAILACFAKRALICTDVGGIAELVSGGLEPTLVERPVTPSSIADAIFRFAALSLDERRARANRSYETLKTHLSWIRIASQYIALIEAKSLPISADRALMKRDI